LNRARPDRLTQYCKDCTKEKAGEWSAKNAARKLANMVRWRTENVERRRLYRASRRELDAAWMKAKRNKDLVATREAAREYQRQWYAANRERWNAKTRNREALKKAVSGSPVDFAAVLARDGKVCWLCGLSIATDLTFDHVIPLSRGGAHSSDNLRPAHRSCNSRKHDKIVRLEQSSLPL
jgi:5-methylcytosine-specific restriction endonuclease McrA